MKMRSLLVIILGFVLNGQGAMADPNVTGVEDGQLSAKVQGVETRWFEGFFAWLRNGHFPPNALGPEGSQGEYIAQVFSYFLSGVDEPMLYNKQMAKDEVNIRLTLMPTREGDIVFHAHSNGNENTLILKLSRTAKLGPYELHTVKVSLDDVAFQRIVDLARATPACHDAHDAHDDRFFKGDGSHWVVELKTAETYCADSVWSPEAGPWQDLAQELFRHFEGDNGVLVTKWAVEMPLSQKESDRFNSLLY